MWISEDGHVKVEITYTKCRDPRFGDLVIPQYRAQRWSEGFGGWLYLVTTANINILAHRLGPYMKELIEFPPPDWEDEAMEVRHGSLHIDRAGRRI